VAVTCKFIFGWSGEKFKHKTFWNSEFQPKSAFLCSNYSSMFYRNMKILKGFEVLFLPPPATVDIQMLWVYIHYIYIYRIVIVRIKWLISVIICGTLSRNLGWWSLCMLRALIGLTQYECHYTWHIWSWHIWIIEMWQNYEMTTLARTVHCYPLDRT